MNRYIVKAIVIMIIFTSSEAFCRVEFKKYEFYKDGGTRCIRYIKNNNSNEVCIDHRESSKTYGKAFIGGYPGKEKSRIMTTKDIKTVIKDLEEIMKGADYKKYTAKSPSRDEIRATIRSSDKQKKHELHKRISYGSIAEFKNELANLMERGINKEDAPDQKAVR